MRPTSCLAASAAACLVIALAPVQAHHAVQAQFDVNQVVEKHGVLTKIDWINPHTYMHFNVTEDGEVKPYAIEIPRRVGIAPGRNRQQEQLPGRRQFQFRDQSQPRRLGHRPPGHADLPRRPQV